MITVEKVMIKVVRSSLSLGVIVLNAIGAVAQLAIDRSVISSGGGRSSDTSFSVEATIGQPAVGPTISGDGFTLSPGFWNPVIGPTAAFVSISGRVMIAPDQALSGAVVVCIDSAGNARTARTSAFGYFSFEEISVGEAYLLSVESKRASFAPRTVVVHDDIKGLEFLPEP